MQIQVKINFRYKIKRLKYKRLECLSFYRNLERHISMIFKITNKNELLNFYIKNKNVPLLNKRTYKLFQYC